MNVKFEWHGDEVLRRIENATGQVSLPDLFPASFMQAHTKFGTLDAMVTASQLVKDDATSEEPAAALQGEVWSQFVASNSTFSSWGEMMSAAATERLKKAFEG